jgi:cytochrome c1
MGIRTYIAGTLPNSPQDLALWIQHPQQVHSGTAMPELGVTPEDAKEIAQYLEELR